MKYTYNQKCFVANGVLWSVYDGLTSAFMIAFALALGASNIVVGLIGAMPYIAMLVAELPGSKLVEYVRRKTIYVSATIFSRSLWACIILAPVLLKSVPLFFVVVVFFFIKTIEALSDPAWASLASDIVPLKVRGSFFGRRNMLMGIASMASVLLAGRYLDIFPKHDLTGFLSVFAVGLCAGIASSLAMSRLREPAYRDHDHHTLKEFFTLNGCFSRFTKIMVFFNFAFMLSSPFFTVYMLRNLGMSYFYFVGASAIAMLSRIIAQQYFGRMSDRYGDKPIAVLCMFGTALVPFIYLFISRENLWMVVPAQVISGAVWAGTDLATFNLLLDFTSPKRRAMQVAEYWFLTSIPMILGPLAGGIIADLPMTGYLLAGIPALFAISSALRAFGAILLSGIPEPRAKREYPLAFVFTKVVAMHPVRGFESVLKVAVRKLETISERLV